MLEEKFRNHSGTISQLYNAFRQFSLLYLLLGSYILLIVGFYTAGAFVPDIRMPRLYIRIAFWISLISALIYALSITLRLLKAGDPRPTLSLVQKLWLDCKGDRAARAANVIFLFLGMIVTFSTVKSSIPSMNPFVWDQWLIKADRALFGGYDAWQWTATMFGSDAALVSLNFIYNLWLVIVVGWIVWVAWLKNPELQLRSLYAMTLGWFVAGNILAIWWSSAGPCFVDRLFGDETYRPLLNMLYESHQRTGKVWALGGQDLLLFGHQQNVGAISGISAMPSLHVLFSVLMVCSTWRYGAAARIVSVLFATTIWIGSIQLAWHYALDGIVGALLAVLFWKIAAFPARWSLSNRIAVPLT